MAKRKNGKSGEPRTGRAERVAAGSLVSGPIKTHGASHREVWHVTTGGERRTYVTSSKSVKTMDEAIGLYGRALKRLAHR